MLSIAEKLLAGNREALAKAISMVERRDPEAEYILHDVFPSTGKSYVVGVTGAPGAGKSTVVSGVTKEFRKRGLKIGIIAIDPTSPFSGGALLGDRLRMSEHFSDSGVYIRSLGTRGKQGGLAKPVNDIIRLLDGFGCDLIIVETVGVGQSEIDVKNVADTIVLALTPKTGDVIQTMKAGIMEVADLYIVNKCDIDGARQTAQDVETTLSMRGESGWRKPVILTDAIRGKGLAEFAEAILEHKEYLSNQGALNQWRKKKLQVEISTYITEKHMENLWTMLDKSRCLETFVALVEEKKLTPATAATKILEQLGLVPRGN